MANTFTGGSAVTVSRPLDRIFDDAQHTGEVILSGRKLKEYPKIAGKYDLVDTVSIGKCQFDAECGFYGARCQGVWLFL